MKFTATVVVTSNKSGLELLAEYGRLGMEDGKNTFPYKQIKFPVSLDFVRANEAKFNGGCYATFEFDLSKTNASDWEDWGSAGYMLSAKNVNESRLTELLKSI